MHIPNDDGNFVVISKSIVISSLSSQVKQKNVQVEMSIYENRILYLVKYICVSFADFSSLMLKLNIKFFFRVSLQLTKKIFCQTMFTAYNRCIS